MIIRSEMNLPVVKLGVSQMECPLWEAMSCSVCTTLVRLCYWLAGCDNLFSSMEVKLT